MKKFIAKLCVAAAVVCGAGQSQAALVTGNSTTSPAIPDFSPNAGAASDIYIGASQVSGIVAPYVNSVSITFTIAGGWDGDYTLSLIHVAADGLSSQSSTLFSSLLSGTAANSGFTGVILNSSGSAISTGASASSTAAITGTYGVNFSPLVGYDPTGDWILYATDNQSGSSGTLSSWTLNLDVVPEPVNVALGIFGAGVGLVALGRKLKLGKLTRLHPISARQEAEIGLGKS